MLRHNYRGTHLATLYTVQPLYSHCTVPTCCSGLNPTAGRAKQPPRLACLLRAGHGAPALSTLQTLQKVVSIEDTMTVLVSYYLSIWFDI